MLVFEKVTSFKVFLEKMKHLMNFKFPLLIKVSEKLFFWFIENDETEISLLKMIILVDAF